MPIWRKFAAGSARPGRLNEPRRRFSACCLAWRRLLATLREALLSYIEYLCAKSRERHLVAQLRYAVRSAGLLALVAAVLFLPLASQAQVPIQAKSGFLAEHYDVSA